MQNNIPKSYQICILDPFYYLLKEWNPQAAILYITIFAILFKL